MAKKVKDSQGQYKDVMYDIKNKPFGYKDNPFYQTEGWNQLEDPFKPTIGGIVGPRRTPSPSSSQSPTKSTGGGGGRDPRLNDGIQGNAAGGGGGGSFIPGAPNAAIAHNLAFNKLSLAEQSAATAAGKGAQSTGGSGGSSSSPSLAGLGGGSGGSAIAGAGGVGGVGTPGGAKILSPPPPSPVGLGEGGGGGGESAGPGASLSGPSQFRNGIGTRILPMQSMTLAGLGWRGY